MTLKKITRNPQRYIQVGMAFFLAGFFFSMIADGRLIGAICSSLITNKSWLDTVQGLASGFSIPLLCASIYFNLRGLILRRSA